jgi:DNA-binding MarR family transcriptional regulator
MSTPTKKQLKKSAPALSKAEDCMRSLMLTVKMVHKYGGAKFAEHPQFSKLSGPRVGVLFIVESAGAIRMGDLAAKLMVAPRTVTDLVDGLERDGFLRRVPHPTDRRATLIELAPEIKADFNKIAGIRKQFLSEMFSVLSLKEQDELIRLLEKLQQGPLSEFVQPTEVFE